MHRVGHVTDNMATNSITRGANELCDLLLQDLNDYQQGRNPAILETLGRHVELFYRHVLASPDTDDNIFDNIYLLELNFTCSDIARILCASLRTIRRRMDELNITVRD